MVRSFREKQYSLLVVIRVPPHCERNTFPDSPANLVPVLKTLPKMRGPVVIQPPHGVSENWYRLATEYPTLSFKAILAGSRFQHTGLLVAALFLIQGRD